MMPPNDFWKGSRRRRRWATFDAVVTDEIGFS